MVTQERLKELLHYDPETGVWSPLTNRPGPKPKNGLLVGHVSVHGYHEIWVDGSLHKAHRLAVLYMTGCWPADEVDHKNLDRLDNRWSNLRPATHGQNQTNSLMYKNNKIGVKGVCWHKRSRKWRAQSQHDKKKIYLGDFETVSEAQCAYREFVVKHHGEFART